MLNRTNLFRVRAKQLRLFVESKYHEHFNSISLKIFKLGQKIFQFEYET